ncbi:MAG: nucleotide-binding protein [Actinomycetota bacterium]|nr:nucleotide-binding protein [Actinomycetota bacterium]
MFIGSSSEAISVVNRLVGLLDSDFDVHPWNQIFSPGEYTLTTLLQEVEQVDAAIFVFARDDEVKIRGEPGYSARGNVLLEYGIFVARLGRERVLILEEEGVDLPSDVFGITTKSFPPERGPGRNAALELFVQEVVTPKWRDLPLRSSSSDGITDLGLGYAATIRRERQKLDGIVRTLHDFANARKPINRIPIQFGSTSAAISTYAEALGRVERRFWTTTFLSSGFWTGPQGQVLAANEEMLKRIKKSEGQARRLFLLDQPSNLVVQAYRDHRILQRQLQKYEELERLQDQHEHLKSNMKALLEQGFEVRVVFDNTKVYRRLPNGMLSDPKDSELGIYDDFRIDVFEGGQHGVIHAVNSYSPLFQYFPTYLKMAIGYFEELWEKAEPMATFIEDLQDAVDFAKSKIDYESNWLAIYEYALAQEDERMKTIELSRVEEVLREEAKARDLSIMRYLDVGTCTGRYPIELRTWLAPTGKILGVDEDYDCVRFAQANIERKCPDEKRIEILQRDFVAREAGIQGEFDLITCMLGTLSHFGWDRSRTHEDCIQRALTRMAALLSSEGLLFLGTWSDYACRNRHMLGIYRQADRDRLAAWTPDTRELTDRLRSAGLSVVGQVQPEIRLNLTWCRRT